MPLNKETKPNQTKPNQNLITDHKKSLPDIQCIIQNYIETLHIPQGISGLFVHWNGEVVE